MQSINLYQLPRTCFIAAITYRTLTFTQFVLPTVMVPRTLIRLGAGILINSIYHHIRDRYFTTICFQTVSVFHFTLQFRPQRYQRCNIYFQTYHIFDFAYFSQKYGDYFEGAPQAYANELKIFVICDFPINSETNYLQRVYQNLRETTMPIKKYSLFILVLNY